MYRLTSRSQTVPNRFGERSPKHLISVIKAFISQRTAMEKTQKSPCQIAKPGHDTARIRVSIEGITWHQFWTDTRHLRYWDFAACRPHLASGLRCSHLHGEVRNGRSRSLGKGLLPFQLPRPPGPVADQGLVRNKGQRVPDVMHPPPN